MIKKLIDVEELLHNLQIFLPNFRQYFDNKELKSRLMKNNINLISENDIKFGQAFGYDQMSNGEKYCLFDFENAVELFGKKTTFAIREEDNNR